MDKESIKIILDIDKDLQNICDKYDRCAECSVKAFKVKHDIDRDNCLDTHMIYCLLGDNDAAAAFFKEQKSEYHNMCNNTACRNCDVQATKEKHKDIKGIGCFTLYVAIKLLNNV